MAPNTRGVGKIVSTMVGADFHGLMDHSIRENTMQGLKMGKEFIAINQGKHTKEIGSMASRQVLGYYIHLIKLL